MKEEARERAAEVETERSRALLYGLLSRLLAAPPDAQLLRQLSRLEGDETAIGTALAGLAAAAQRLSAAAVREEYEALFVGLGRGELLPYASWYLTGFLYERPLAELRAELGRLGIVRREGNPEPEDHIASVLEVMAGLADGRFGRVDLTLQKRFFERHLDSWGVRFFADLAQARAADFYREVAKLGRVLLEIERVAFAMVD
ncbi:Chaperone protein TorD [bacterium HR40]|nr:Chaperone protein TorD [bacterium HR40]